MSVSVVRKRRKISRIKKNKVSYFRSDIHLNANQNTCPKKEFFFSASLLKTIFPNLMLRHLPTEEFHLE